LAINSFIIFVYFSVHEVQVIDIVLSCILTSSNSAYVNHAKIRSSNQPVLGDEVEVSYSRKQQEPLTEFEHTPDMHLSSDVTTASICFQRRQLVMVTSNSKLVSKVS